MKPFALITLAVMAQNVFALSVGTGDVCKIKELTQKRDERVCVCEVQSKYRSNPKEYPFYKVGCQQWLARQSCSTKKVVDQGEDISDLFDSKSKALILGYVGHWSSSNETINYVKSRIEPIVKEKGVKVFFDNTACSGASDPISMVNYLEELDSEIGSKIILKANENISVGEWNGVLKAIVKTNAPVTTCQDAIQVQSCRKFKNKNCSLFLNYRNTMGCIEKGGEFKVLKCQKKRENQNIKRLSLGKWRVLDTTPGQIQSAVVSRRDLLKDRNKDGFFGSVSLFYNVVATYEMNDEVISNEYVDSTEHYEEISWELFDRQLEAGFSEEMRQRYETEENMPLAGYESEDGSVEFDHAIIYAPGTGFSKTNIAEFNKKFGYIDYGNQNLNTIISENPDEVDYYRDNFSLVSNYYKIGRHYRNNRDLNRRIRDYVLRNTGLND